MSYSSTHTTNKETGNNNFAGTNAHRAMPAVPVLQKVEPVEEHLQMKPNNTGMQMKEGVAVNDDKGLESKADVTGGKALQRKVEESRVAGNSVAQKKSNGELGIRFVDNGPMAIAQRKLQKNQPLQSQIMPYTNVIQGEFIAVIGEEVPAGSTTLHDGAETLMERFGEETYYKEKDIDAGEFKTPKFDETIYLIAHGDNPGVSLTKEAALGDKSGVQVKNIVKNILRKFAHDHKEEQFTGRIILEGCHTAEPVIDEDEKAKKGSMLYDFQQAMKDDKFFTDKMAPEARIGGYMGQAFSNGDYVTGYGSATTEHPLTKRFQKQRGVTGRKNRDGSISYDNKESFIESRWKKNLDFGKPK